MKRAMFVLCVFGAVAGFSGCAQREVPTMILAVSKTGELQFDYSGPGTYAISRLDNTYTFRFGPPAGGMWVAGTVSLQRGNGSDVILAIDSDASQPFETRLLGFALTAGSVASEEDTQRTMQIAAGNQTLRLKRFVVHTYELRKQ